MGSHIHVLLLEGIDPDIRGGYSRVSDNDEGSCEFRLQFLAKGRKLPDIRPEGFEGGADLFADSGILIPQLILQIRGGQNAVDLLQDKGLGLSSRKIGAGRKQESPEFPVFGCLRLVRRSAAAGGEEFLLQLLSIMTQVSQGGFTPVKIKVARLLHDLQIPDYLAFDPVMDNQFVVGEVPETVVELFRRPVDQHSAVPVQGDSD